MKKFFDSRRELVGSGPGPGAPAGGLGSGGGGGFIGRVFNIGRYQVTVEETIAEGELRTQTTTSHQDTSKALTSRSPYCPSINLDNHMSQKCKGVDL